MFQAPTAAAAKLLDFIASFEAPHGYDTVFGNNNQKFSPIRLTAMTLDQVLVAQIRLGTRLGSSAVGRYQFIHKTLAGLKTALALNGATRFDPNLQDSLAFNLLRQRGYERFVAKTLALNDFALNLAQEWASLPVLQATQGKFRPVARGQSFYAGDGLNRALVAPERLTMMLGEVLAMARGSSTIAVTPIAKPEGTMVNNMAGGQQAQMAANVLDPKQWYQSKAVIGGLIAVAAPLISMFFPTAKLVDPTVATDWLMKAIQVVGPIAGGLLAIYGRTQATNPIAGSAAAAKVQNAVAITGQPDLLGNSSQNLMGLPLGQIIAELPTVVESLQQLGVNIFGASGAPAVDIAAGDMPSSLEPSAFPPEKDTPTVAVRPPQDMTLAEIKAALALVQEIAAAAPAVNGVLAPALAQLHSDTTPVGNA